MSRSRRTEVSPPKLSNGIEFLRTYTQELNDSTETTNRYNDKGNDKPIHHKNSQGTLNPYKNIKTLTDEDDHVPMVKSNKIHNQIAALVSKDRVIKTERQIDMRKSGIEDQSIEAAEMLLENNHNFYTEVGPFKIQEIQDIQRSVGDIQKKLKKVKRFFTSLSPETSKRGSRSERTRTIENSIRTEKAQASKGRPMFIDELDVNKIQLFEKFAKNLKENEEAKKRIIDEIREAVEVLDIKEKQKKLASENAARAKSMMRVASVGTDSRPAPLKAIERSLEKARRYWYLERPQISKYVPPVNSSRDADHLQEFLKRKRMMQKYMNPVRVQTNASNEFTIDGSVSYRPLERQNNEKKTGSKKDKLFMMEGESEFVSKNESGLPVRPRAAPAGENNEEKEFEEKKREKGSEKKESRERQRSQPGVIISNHEESLKTITLQIPKERKAHRSGNTQSSGNMLLKNSLDGPAILKSVQSVEATKPKQLNYLPQLRSFLQAKGKKKEKWESILEKDMKKVDKVDLLKVNLSQLEEKAKMSQQKIKYGKTKQDIIEEKDNLDKCTVDAIKAKLAIINQLHGEQ